MFQFRFVLLALLIPVAGAAAFLGGTSAIHGIVMPPYEDSSNAAVVAASGAVATFASQSVDAAAAASDGDVAQALVKKKLSLKAEAALLGKSGGLEAPSFGLLVGLDGAVVGKSGTDPKLPDNLGGMPVVAEALRGLSRDGVWMQEGLPVHLAASACYDNDGSLAGAVVLGWAYTPEIVSGFGRQASAPTFVIAGKNVIGALPEGVATSDLTERMPTFGAPTTSWGPLPLLVPEMFRYQVASLPLYAGEPIALVTLVDRNKAYDGLARMQAAILGSTLFLLVMVLGIIASTLRAMNRPLELITEHLSQVQQQGASVGILPEAGLGPMLRLGKQINMLLQTMPSARPGSTAPLFAGSASTSQDVPMPSSSAFGGDFPSMPPTAPASPSMPMSMPPSPMSMPPQMVQPSSPPVAPTPPPQQAPAGSGLAGLFDDDPLKAFRVPPTKAAPPPPPEPEPIPEPQLHAMQPEATVMFQVPQSLLQASATASTIPPPSAPAQVSRTSVDDNRTVVAQVPQELLAQVAPKNDVDAADEAHYKEVYEKFVQTRIECGEDTSDLSYDRFVTKLLKNRQQIVEKHKAKSVRFQVYAKDGKAALRALPVRD